MSCTHACRADHSAPLKTVSRCLFTVIALIALAIPALAQKEATGTVYGRVQNASNGTYVKNAKVTIAGTGDDAVSDEFGNYVIANAPVGERTLRVSYVGEPDQSISVTVEADKAVNRSILVGQSDATKLEKDGTVKLDPFVVNAERYKNARAIAIAEERFSVNMKNVISTDEFGEIPGGNVGELIKYLPGVELEYGGTYIAPTDAFGVSIRGFGPEDTAITIDGVPVTSASQASLTNQVGLDMLSINNASRVELIKVATPDMPMNSVGGSINLVSKSAFEYARPSFSYKVYAVVNSTEPNPFAKVVGPTPKRVRAGQPGFELSYVKPINEKLGISLTASRFSQYSANQRLRPEFGTSSVSTDLRPLGGANPTILTNSVGPISLTNPFLTRVSITDSPRTSDSNSGSFRVDWRPVPGLAIAANYQLSTYTASDTDRRAQFRIQRPLDWNATSVTSLPYLNTSQSATTSALNPSNSVSQDITARDKEGITHSGYLKATYQKGPWDIIALASQSRSRASFLDFENGHFSGVDVSVNVGTMKFENVQYGIPGAITVYDRTGLELNKLDYTKLANWSSPTILAKSGNAESLDESTLYQFDLRRELDFLPWQAAKFAFKTGFRYDETNKVKWGRGTGYRESYIGPALAVTDYLDDTYLGTSPGWGFSPQEFVSAYKMYDIYKAHPENFTITDADAKENYWSALGQNKALKEKKDAWYALLEGRAVSDRLRFVAGLRNETTTRDGYGPQGDAKWNYVKNADGSTYRNVALLGGVGTVRIDQATSKLFATDTIGTALRSDLAAKSIAFPTAIVTSTSLVGGQLQRKTAAIHGESKGDPNYSLSTSFDVTKKLVAKVAYSIASGRIPIEDATRGLLSGNQNDFNINENDDPAAIPRGIISVANPNLLPESSKNWDFELSYYTDNGGKFSASYYLKSISNFADTFITTSGNPEFDALAESLGLDPADYKDWEIRTSENGIGTGKSDGYELQASQDFRFLGAWGRNLRFFSSFSHKKRSETDTTRISARPSAANLATGGISFSNKRVNLTVRGTWTEDVFQGNAATFTLPDGVTKVNLGSFAPSALKIDVTGSYQISSRYSAYFSARNILSEGLDKKRYDALGLYPAYAQWDDYRDTGVQVTVGFRGTF